MAARTGPYIEEVQEFKRTRGLAWWRKDLIGPWLRVAVLLLFSTLAPAQTDLSQLSIEDLMNITVTSASKKEQKLNETAAAVYIITQEDIRHSGMTSIPELLRMVPGLSVAQMDANTWAITSRGSSGRFANRLLVLMDGRSVYTPTYSGVYWDVQDLLLEDIDRLEVIRGPGATMWGANAVNGVINIITKRAQDTQGAMITSGISLTDQRFAGMRYGGNLGQDGFYRIYGKYLMRDSLVYSDGSGAADGWDMARGGFRSDYAVTARDNLTFQGDIYGGTVGQRSHLFAVNPLVTAVDEQMGMQGANLIGRWTRASSPRSEFSLLGYVDTTRRYEWVIGQRVTTFDLEFQHHRRLGERHDVVWGLGYRRIDDKIRNSAWATFTPATEGTNLFSGFVQDEISMLKQRLWLTVGSKFEHNDYTGFEVQPNVRLSFAATPRHHLWAAVARAIRTPSRGERDVQTNFASGLLPGLLPGGIPFVATVFGNRALVAEKLISYEAGYRWRPSSRASIDLAGFYNKTDDETSAGIGMPYFSMTPLPPHMVVPIPLGNANSQKAFGTEVVLNLNVAKWWKIVAADTWQQFDHSSATPTPSVVSAGQFSADTPHQQVNMRSTLFLPRKVEVDVASYYVGRFWDQQVPSYTRLDVRLGWRPSRQMELSLGGQNLIADRHLEYGAVFGFIPTEVRRNAYMRAIWHF